MSPDIRLLLSIQALDEDLAALDARIDEIPKHIGAIEKKLQTRLAELKADKDALARNQKTTRDLEGEIGAHTAKISKLKGQLLDAKTNEQYRALQHEIEFNEAAIRKAEDEQLALMEQAETLSANVHSADLALKTEEATIKVERAEAEARLAELKASRNASASERQTLLGELSRDVLRNYENLRRRGRRRVVTEADGTTCGACHVTIRPQVLQDLVTSEELRRCENCGAYLYSIPATEIDANGPSR
ncbi:MAG: C4-type zinc ribbon domain-containing protein [Bryobacterales bacterium]|nr:C4-type zinc ribbon domain-containing protein [Bryobacterales bacterium]